MKRFYLWLTSVVYNSQLCKKIFYLRRYFDSYLYLWPLNTALNVYFLQAQFAPIYNLLIFNIMVFRSFLSTNYVLLVITTINPFIFFVYNPL